MMYESLVGFRVVLRCQNNLTFAGIFKDIVVRNDKKFIWIVTDEISQFGILCPVDFIYEMIKVPI